MYILLWIPRFAGYRMLNGKRKKSDSNIEKCTGSFYRELEMETVDHQKVL